MAFNGNTVWHKAEESDPNYKRYSEAWKKWSERNPDGEIRDAANGNPKVSPLWTAEYLGNPALKRLLFKMLNPDPNKRITINEALNASIIKGVECCTPESNDEPTPEQKLERTRTGECLLSAKVLSKSVLRKHNHFPAKEHKTPHFFQHRFDMGDGWR
jgi:protein-serine/threonine kinase